MGRSIPEEPDVQGIGIEVRSVCTAPDKSEATSSVRDGRWAGWSSDQQCSGKEYAGFGIQHLTREDTLLRLRRFRNEQQQAPYKQKTGPSG